MCEMARRGWISYCKDSSGNIQYFTELVDRGKDVGLKCFVGDENIMMDCLLLKACGAVPICSNFQPRVYIRAYEAALLGDLAEVARSRDIIRRINEVVILGGANWIAGAKCAVAGLGIGMGMPLSPLEPASERQKAAIADLSENCSVFISS